MKSFDARIALVKRSQIKEKIRQLYHPNSLRNYDGMDGWINLLDSPIHRFESADVDNDDDEAFQIVNQINILINK